MKKLLKPKLKYSFIIPLFIISLFLISCAGSGNMVQDNIKNAEIEHLAKLLYERGQDLKSFAGQGNISYIKDGQRHFFHFQMIAEKPDKILFSVFESFGGAPVFKFASDGEKFYNLSYSEKKMSIGNLNNRDVMEFLPLSLSYNEAWSLLMASSLHSLPKEAMARERKILRRTVTELTYIPMLASNQLWKVQLTGSLSEQKAENSVIEKAFFKVNKKNIFNIEYGTFKNVAREDKAGKNVMFPHKINIQWEDGSKQILEVNYNEVRLGLSLKDNFNIKAPENFTIENLPD